jgi:hypothetical protein
MNFHKISYVITHQREIFGPLTFLADWRHQDKTEAKEAKRAHEHHGHVTEQIRVWQLASVLALSAGCAGTTELRHQASPQWSATQLVQMDWLEEEGENWAAAPPGEGGRTDNERPDQEDETNNASAKPGGQIALTHGAAHLESPDGESLEEPLNDGHRALGTAGGAPYQDSVYSGGCVAGTAMGFSAPICN